MSGSEITASLGPPVPRASASNISRPSPQNALRRPTFSPDTSPHLKTRLRMASKTVRATVHVKLDQEFPDHMARDRYSRVSCI
jgi:hypothetical protein